MKFTVRIFISIVFFYVNLGLFAQDAVIKGIIKDRSITGKVTLSVFDVPTRSDDGSNHKRLLESDIVDGEFQFHISGIKSWVYARIRYPENMRRLKNPQGEERIAAPLFDIIENGDDVTITIDRDNEISFSGPGSEKYTCAYQMNRLYSVKHKERYSLFNKNYNGTQLQTNSIAYGFRFKVYDSLFDVLKEYKNKLNKSVFDIMAVDLFFHTIELIFDRNGTYLGISDQDSAQSIEVKRERYAGLFAHINKLKDKVDLSQSIFAANVIKSLERDWFIFFEERTLPTVEQIIVLFGKYKGRLKDKMLTEYAIGLNQFGKKLDESERKEATKKIAQNINTETYKNILVEYYRSAPGEPAYPFSLIDVDGKKVTLESLKGKLIVADYWFNGCIGCVGLNESLKYIIEKYKKRRDIVFLSINVDANRERWLKGLKSGNYTHPESVNVSTYSDGAFSHPVFTYYNYVGCPQLLLIDKSGNIISSRPPRPVSTSNTREGVLGTPSTKDFIKLIEDNL